MKKTKKSRSTRCSHGYTYNTIFYSVSSPCVCVRVVGRITLFAVALLEILTTHTALFSKNLFLLKDFPKLADAKGRDEIEKLACYSSVIQHAAQLEHKKKMKQKTQSWWKRLQQDQDDDEDLFSHIEPL